MNVILTVNCFSPIHEAADSGHTEVIRLLLSYGADPQLATYCGQTPSDITTDMDVKELLDNHLADVQGHKASLWTVESYWGPGTYFCV
jgi:ankyrin repeat protein